jgi:hypothetical protein
MSGESPRPQPAGKSKTDLRRGEFTPGNPSTKKRPAPPSRSTSTTNDEQAALFGEDTK